MAFVFHTQGYADFRNKMQGATGALSTLGRQGTQTAQQTQQVTRDMKGAALGMAGAASSAVSLYYQYDNLQKNSLAVSRAQKSLTSAQATAITAQESLNKMVADGVTSGPEYEAAVLRNRAAQEQLKIATEKVDIAQGDLTEAQLGFALQIIPTVLTSVTGVTGALGMMGVSLKGTSIASKLAGFSFKTMGLTMKMALIGTGIGAILVGVGIALEMIASNAFGVRDAINSMGKAIGDALPFLKPVMEFFGSVGNALFGGGFNGVPAPGDAEAEGALPDWASAGANYGKSTTEAIGSFGGMQGGGGGGGDTSVNVYVDGKEISKRIKISTGGKT